MKENRFCPSNLCNIIKEKKLVFPLITTLLLFIILISVVFDKKPVVGDYKSKKSLNDEQIEVVIRDWIDKNPDLIIASVQKYQSTKMQEQVNKARKNVVAKKEEIFNSKDDPIYKSGKYDVEIVEFFDYNCGFCKKSNKVINDLIKQDNKIKVIFKEYPILGPDSLEKAKIALALNIIDPSKFLQFHNKIINTPKNASDLIDIMEKDMGISKSKIRSTLEKNKNKIEEIINANHALGSELAISGTPAFIIGNEVIPGAVGVKVLKEKIKKIRKEK